MALVAVKNKYQVVIPRHIRDAVGVEVGDLLAESMADFAAARSFGPFKTDKELIKSLHQEALKFVPRLRQTANREITESQSPVAPR
jgi:bifunctional DNA-binding transcriptional regulator/antitoxin component of YhaV-PrlF toxin-antitoxin module